MDSTARTHLHHAHDSLKHAAGAVHERMADHCLGHEVRAHLRQAARHMLHAGLAVIDAADARHAHRQQPPAAQPPAQA